MVAEDSQNDVTPGSSEVGEVWCRGSTLFGGYWHAPEAATRDAFAPGGWFRTGDLATMEASGNLRVVDRKKDMVGALSVWGTVQGLPFCRVLAGARAAWWFGGKGCFQAAWDDRACLSIMAGQALRTCRY